VSDDGIYIPKNHDGREYFGALVIDVSDSHSKKKNG